MPSPTTLTNFALSALLLILLPGPAMLFLVARGVAGGPRVGALSALGVATATATYVLATALGLTAVVAASSSALLVVRLAGAAYLVYLGITTLRDRSTLPVAGGTPVDPAPVHPWVAWRQGFLVGVGNPKVALFFLAFFPQFLHPDAGPVWSQVLVLGAIITGIGLVLDTGYGVFGGLVRARLGRSGGALRRGRIVVGLTYLGLGGVAAATGQRAA